MITHAVFSCLVEYLCCILLMDNPGGERNFLKQIAISLTVIILGINLTPQRQQFKLLYHYYHNEMSEGMEIKNA